MDYGVTHFWEFVRRLLRRIGRLVSVDTKVSSAIADDRSEPNETAQTASDPLADDILEGADAIAEFLFGSRESRRKVYYLAECSKLPIFRLGSVLCARKSVLLQFITGQESKALPPEDQHE